MVTTVSLIAIKISVALLIMAIGLGARLTDASFLLHRPGLLLRSVLAMYVLVPLTIFALAKLLPLTGSMRAALLVLAVSAGAPLLPRKLQAYGNGAFSFSLVVISSLLAIVLAPAWLALFARHFGAPTLISVRDVASAIAITFLAPLLAGMVAGRVFPALADRYASRISAIAGLVLALGAVVLLGAHWRMLAEIDLIGLVALLLLVTIATLIGHVCGGPSEGNRTTLAIACATRHLGVAVIIATAFPGPRVVVILACYLLTSAIISLPYLRWRRRVAEAAAASHRQLA